MNEPSSFERWLADLPPGSFAIVMATGIIADAAFQQLLGGPARAFFWMAAGLYVALWILFLLRAIRQGRRFLRDLTSLPHAPSCLGAVAGTNVLGAGFVLIIGWHNVGFALWTLGIVLWSIIFYAVLTAATIGDPKPDLAGGVSGEWLMLVVATEW